MTTRTLTAFFDSAADAKAARDRLCALGLPQDAVRMIDQASAEGAVPGGAERRDERTEKSFLQTIKELFTGHRDRSFYEEGIRRGGYLLIVQVPEQITDRAIDVLEKSNAVDLEQREAEWRAQGWRGEETGTPASRPEASREERIPIVEEHLLVGKREVRRGGVRVRAYVREEPVREQVQLREEHVEIERRPVNQPVSGTGAEAAAAANDLLQEREVELTESAEEAVVAKEAVVKEELVVKKRADERVEEVSETVRRTEVDVEELPPGSEGTAAPKPRPSKPPPQSPARRH